MCRPERSETLRGVVRFAHSAQRSRFLHTHEELHADESNPLSACRQHVVKFQCRYSELRKLRTRRVCIDMCARAPAPNRIGFALNGAPRWRKVREWALECRWFAGEKGRLLCCVCGLCTTYFDTSIDGSPGVWDAQCQGRTTQLSQCIVLRRGDDCGDVVQKGI